MTKTVICPSSGTDVDFEVTNIPTKTTDTKWGPVMQALRDNPGKAVKITNQSQGGVYGKIRYHLRDGEKVKTRRDGNDVFVWLVKE